MSSVEQPQQQPTKRTQRHKKTTNIGDSQPHLTTEVSQDDLQTAPTPSKGRKKRNNNNNQKTQPHSQSEITAAININPVSPLTPPRVANDPDMNIDIQVSPLATTTSRPNNNGNPTVNGTGKGKKKQGPNNSQKENTATTPRPRKNRVPQPQPQPQSQPYNQPQPQQSAEQVPTVTPAKASQKYAGPTFHASPAASALPIPKFFSKSVPQVHDKESSLQAMMQEDCSEESASQGDESPTLRNAQIAGERVVREESPLDFFFKADRAQKAQKKFDDVNLSTPNEKFRASSASPSRLSPQIQSRPQSNHGGMFALEMDGDAGKSTSSLSDSKTATPKSTGSQVTPDSAQTAKDKTEALKQLLFQKTQQGTSSPGSLSPSPSPTPPRSGAAWDSPAMNTRSRNGSPSPYSSIYSGGMSASKPPFQRAHSSQLRKEVSADSASELPVTPTPSRSKDFFGQNGMSYSTTRATPPPRNDYPRNTPNFEAQDALKASLGNDAGSHSSVGGALSPDFVKELLQRHLSGQKLGTCGTAPLPLRTRS